MKKRQAIQRRYCRNCHRPMTNHSTFCAYCSQKYTDGKVTIKALIVEFIETTFNINSKFFKTAQALFSPGKLTIEYFKGRHKRYAHPVRLFIVLAIFHFAILGLVLSKEINSDFDNDNRRRAKDAAFAMYQDSIDAASKEVLQLFDEDEKIRIALDSLNRRLPDYSKGSVEYGYFKLEEDWSKIEMEWMEFSLQDYSTLTEEELVNKAGVKGVFNRLQARQILKVNRNGGNFGRFILGKLIWMVLLMMPALALILKSLYWRRKRFYVEHLIFSFHYHAFAFTIVSVFLIIHHFVFPNLGENQSGLLWTFVFFGVLFYLYKAMRRVYQQGRFRTFIKFIILNFSYLFIFILFLVLTFFVSIFIF